MRTSVKFGVALGNFESYPNVPDTQQLIRFAQRAEELNYESVWVWDHILLGVDPCFPIIDSLTLLAALAATTQKVKLGIGVLVLPLRNPVTLVKQLTSIDHISNGRLTLGVASGWYKREFDAVGVDFHQRGKIMDLYLDIMNHLLTEDWVTGEFGPYNLRDARMFPKAVQSPRPPLLIGGYVDRVLKRAGVRGDGWLTYFYTPNDFATDWRKVCTFAEEAGRDPSTLTSCNQIPIVVGPRSKVEGPMNEWLNTEWDFAKWSKSTPDSAIMGTPGECLEQIQAHVDAGVDRIIFVPYRYEMEQIQAIAREVIPLLKSS
jgi:alkanesulfonate monooxygenase